MTQNTRVRELLEDHASEPDSVLWDMIRHMRDRALKNSDWTVGNDTPLSDAAQAAWRDYRQDLRDITEAFQAPWDVTFPDPPA